MSWKIYEYRIDSILLMSSNQTCLSLWTFCSWFLGFWCINLLVTLMYKYQTKFTRCTGMTQRDGMGREVGGGFRIGNTCTPVMDSCQCMAKPILWSKEKKERKSMGPNHQRYPHICKFYFLELYKILTVNTREKSPHASRKLHREMNHFKIFQIILFFWT